MTVLLLLGVTIPIALVASAHFEAASRQREENINLDLVAARGTEVEGVLNSALDKARSYASVLLKMASDPSFSSDDFTLGFMRERSFLSLEVFKVDGAKAESLKRVVKADLIKDAFKADPASLDRAQAWAKFPLEAVAGGAVEIANGSFQGGPAALFIGFPLVKDADGHITHAALAAIDLGLLQKPLSDVRERTFYVTDRRGMVLAHSDEAQALARSDFSKLEIAQIAGASQTPRGEKLLADPETGERAYAAYAKTTLGVTVFGEVPEQVILEPSREVRRKTFFIAGIALSISLFVVFVFSLTVTAPLERLARLSQLIATGNFDVQAASKMQAWFRDEVGELAVAFDHMTAGLKERDKVKRLFSKFHGSSVTENLLQGEATLGGQRKEVVVFFSDIRGFTSYSEKRSPEEVVEMLNEYFGIMVGIINKNGGVVDKFIGDAIMAIWGAPVSSGSDAANAVRAALEMRKGLSELNERRIARNQDPILIGMGLHLGPVISGTIGSNERMEYTVIGNVVNTASRIEAATKAFGSDLLVSSEVLARVEGLFETELAGAAEVKGRSEELKLYRVRGIRLESGEVRDLSTPYSHFEPEHADKITVAGSMAANGDVGPAVASPSDLALATGAAPDPAQGQEEAVDLGSSEGPAPGTIPGAA
jgi:adenylate cyclase